jgi:hypothetical protein
LPFLVVIFALPPFLVVFSTILFVFLEDNLLGITKGDNGDDGGVKGDVAKSSSGENGGVKGDVAKSSSVNPLGITKGDSGENGGVAGLLDAAEFCVENK